MALSMTTRNRIASRGDVRARLRELNDLAAPVLIMSITERKEWLNAIARATILSTSESTLCGDNILGIAEPKGMEGIGSCNKDVDVTQAFTPISGVEFRMNFPHEPSRVDNN
jgi:hypothetical protein